MINATAGQLPLAAFLACLFTTLSVQPILVLAKKIAAVMRRRPSVGSRRGVELLDQPLPRIDPSRVLTAAHCVYNPAIRWNCDDVARRRTPPARSPSFANSLFRSAPRDKRDRGFESASLQRGVRCELDTAVRRSTSGVIAQPSSDQRNQGGRICRKHHHTRPSHEKGAKQHSMPCHHALAEALRAYIDAPASSRTARAGCFVPHAGTTAVFYPTSP
jgi:hypothetical protein